MKTTSVFSYLFLFAAVLATHLHGQSADTVITNVTDYLTLQTALDIAESNMSPDVISIGKGTISLEGLDQYFTWEPPTRPEPALEEHYPLTIQGAGPDKTILDGAGSSILTVFTSKLSDDFGANVTISGICFRNITDGTATALGIGTEKAQIMVYNCRFEHCSGSEGAALTASTGFDSETSGGIHIEKCTVDSCSGAVRLTAHSVIPVKNCTFRDNAAIRFSRMPSPHLPAAGRTSGHGNCYTLLGRTTGSDLSTGTLPTGIYIYTSPGKQPFHHLYKGATL